ncbi:uncharacterized protein [Dermacentor andersoni]|uniref:uncharacterized protein n=1 Tax=Dermacentor andersoni TaxID=34620 RepID=UPI003B3BBAAB
MSSVRREALHQLSNYAVIGVNWRPMRLVEEVPPEHVCKHCHVIPQRTVLLPCKHAFCGLCCEANSSASRSVCPIDQQSCGKDELQTIVLPARIANSLKAHCWNESKGCEFVGAMDALLHHYEEECEFRFLQCAVTGETILHKDLPAHCKAGCVGSGAEAYFACSNQTIAQDTVPSAEDIKDTVEKQKKRLEYLRERLSKNQDRINNLGETLATQECKLQELELQRADGGRRPKGGFSRAVRNVVRRSFREVRRAVSSRQQPPRENAESVEHLVDTVAIQGKACSWEYEGLFQDDGKLPQSKPLE